MRALRWLYPDHPPVRGQIAVQFRAGQEEGVTGVMAAVVGLLTGAAGVGGFKGIAGRFARHDLLQFGADIPLELRFIRLDNDSAVDVALHLSRVPADPALRDCLGAALGDTATPSVRQQFAALWQQRVLRILVDQVDDPGLVEVRPVSRP